MRILFVGDSPTVSTGFARCTRAACDALHAAGHEVRVLGINESGDPRPPDIPYPIYTCLSPYDSGRDVFGVTRLPRLVARLKPDLIILLNDPWNIKSYTKYLKDTLDESIPIPPIIAWLAVDSLNQSAAAECNNLLHVIVWTEFGAIAMQQGGYTGPISVIGLGVNDSTSSPTFFPVPKEEARRHTLPPSVPPDSFIVGVVGRNQLRKRLDLTIEYFSRWLRVRSITDAYLLLHVAPTGDTGFDIKSLCNYYGIADRVLIRTPHIGHGDQESKLNLLYNSLDVLASTSQAEGWDLPVLEAMACGVPCLVPGFAALGPHGWTRDAAVQVPCTSSIVSAPLNRLAYTIGGIPDRATFVSELHALYSSHSHRQAHSQRGSRLAGTLTWDRCGREFVAVVEQAWAEHGDRQRRREQAATVSALGITPQNDIGGGTSADTVLTVAVES